MKHSESIEHFNRVLERDPANGDAHYYLAVANAELGNIEEARRHYSRLLPSSGKFERRDYGLGLLALQEGDLEAAERFISQAAVSNATDLSVRQAHVFVFRKLNVRCRGNRDTTY